MSYMVRYMYRKIKSVAYYKSHKLQVENIPYLLQLGAKAGHIFPLAQHVLDLLSPGVFQQKMERVLAQVVTLLDFADPANTLLSRIRMGHALTVAKAKRKKMPKDPLAGFDQRPFDVQCRIVINSPFVNFSREVAELFQADRCRNLMCHKGPSLLHGSCIHSDRFATTTARTSGSQRGVKRSANVIIVGPVDTLFSFLLYLHFAKALLDSFFDPLEIVHFQGGPKMEGLYWLQM